MTLWPPPGLGTVARCSGAVAAAIAMLLLVGPGATGVETPRHPAAPASTTVAWMQLGAPGRATTRPPGSPPLSDLDAAVRVRLSPKEPRPQNARPNHRVPSPAELGAFHRAQAALDEWNVVPNAQKVTGRFVGTTDEIIQWAAWKWGIDEDVIRAVACAESWWRQTGPGSVGSDGSYKSYGLVQVLDQYPATHPLSELSTAFNVDFYGAVIRHNFDGDNRWFNTVERGREYGSGDIWGAVGAWYAGAWWTPAARWYVGIVKGHLAGRDWDAADF